MNTFWRKFTFLPHCWSTHYCTNVPQKSFFARNSFMLKHFLSPKFLFSCLNSLPTCVGQGKCFIDLTLPNYSSSRTNHKSLCLLRSNFFCTLLFAPTLAFLHSYWTNNRFLKPEVGVTARIAEVGAIKVLLLLPDYCPKWERKWASHQKAFSEPAFLSLLLKPGGPGSRED